MKTLKSHQSKVKSFEIKSRKVTKREGKHVISIQGESAAEREGEERVGHQDWKKRKNG